MIKINSKIRKNQLLDIAIALALKIGYKNITKMEIARIANVSHALINAYFGTMHSLKHKVLTAAIKRNIPEIVAQGLIAKDPRALRAPEQIKKDAVNFLATK